MGTITRGFANKVTADGVSSLDSTVITGATAETTIAGGDTILLFDDSASALRKMTRTNFIGGVGGFETQLLHVRDEKASGTAGGTFTSGSFQTRTLNTSLTNEISGASLATNQITLPSGTYYIEAVVQAYAVENHKLKLRNITDSSNVLIGSSNYASSSGFVGNNASLSGRFTIAAQKTFEIQHRSSLTTPGNGFGASAGFSVVEVYSDIKIWKVA